MEGEGPKRLQLSATGPGPVKAGDIAVSGDIDVLNPDLIICHLDEGATLNMELTAAVDSAMQQAVEVIRRSEEHTSELQSLMRISYAVFCLKKKTELINNIDSNK